jgi:hypothetical protein
MCSLEVERNSLATSFALFEVQCRTSWATAVKTAHDTRITHVSQGYLVRAREGHRCNYNKIQVPPISQAKCYRSALQGLEQRVLANAVSTPMDRFYCCYVGPAESLGIDRALKWIAVWIWGVVGTNTAVPSRHTSNLSLLSRKSSISCHPLPNQKLFPQVAAVNTTALSRQGP